MPEAGKLFSKIIDMGLENNTMKKVLSVLENNKVCIVGFSCTTETYHVSVRMADRIKETYRNCMLAVYIYKPVFSGYTILKGNRKISVVVIS